MHEVTDIINNSSELDLVLCKSRQGSLAKLIDPYNSKTVIRKKLHGLTVSHCAPLSLSQSGRFNPGLFILGTLYSQTYLIMLNRKFE